MNQTNGTTPTARISEIFQRISKLETSFESSLATRPLATAGAVAGIAFIAGAIAGSRVARAVLVAATPVLMRRLLQEPLVDDLINRARGAATQAKSTAS